MSNSFNDVIRQTEDKLESVQSMLESKMSGDSSASLNLKIMKGVSDCELQIKKLAQFKQSEEEMRVYIDLKSRVIKIKEEQRRILMGIQPVSTIEKEKFEQAIRKGFKEYHDFVMKNKLPISSYQLEQLIKQKI